MTFEIREIVNLPTGISIRVFIPQLDTVISIGLSYASYALMTKDEFDRHIEECVANVTA